MDHLPSNHHKWCKAFDLYQKLVITQKKVGRIEADLPTKIMTKPYVLPTTIDDVFKDLYRSVTGKSKRQPKPAGKLISFFAFPSQTSKTNVFM